MALMVTMRKASAASTIAVELLKNSTTELGIGYLSRKTKNQEGGQPEICRLILQQRSDAMKEWAGNKCEYCGTPMPFRAAYQL